MDNKELLVIPDIHGRTFWKEAMLESEECEIVFLGDYLDPYPSEDIGREEAWNNFLEIVDFKKSHMSNVHLLLGNHDIAYIEPLLRCSRNDEMNRARIHEFFVKNMFLFDMAYETVSGGRRVLISHAGLNRKWLMKYQWLFGGTEVTADALNYGLHDEAYQKSLLLVMSDVSRYRGGMDDAGSMVWADIHEFMDEDCLLPDTFQIVGHTQQYEPLWIGKSVVCVDCRTVFRMVHGGKKNE